MSIQVTCPNCAKQYAAPASMAGRQVRCKYCGGIFTVAGEAELAAAQAPASHAVAGAPSHSPAAAPDVDADAVFSQAFQDYVPPTRPNVPFKFPTAAALDRGLPSVLVVIAGVWLAQQMLGSGGSLPGWVGPLRLAVALLLFVVVVFPMTWLAARAASRKMKFDLPPAPKWRVVGAYALPFTLAWVCWFGAAGIDGLIYGGLFGLVLGSAAVWLLLRLEPKEATATLAYTTAGFAVAVGLAVGLVAGANAIAVQVAREVKGPTRLTASPFAPGLGWDVPPQPAKRPNLAAAEAPDAPEPSPANPQPPKPTGPDPRQARPGPAVADGGSAPAVAASSTTPPPPGTAGDSGNTGGSILFNDNPPASPLTATTPPTSPGRSGEAMVSSPITPPASGRGGVSAVGPGVQRTDAFIDAIRAARSPLVSAVAPVAPGGTLTEFVPALTGAPAALFVEAGKAEASDTAEVWSLAPPQRRFVRPDIRTGYDRTYAVSPGGTAMVRVVKFPGLSFEVWANDRQVVSKSIPVPADRAGAQPTVLGFLTEDRFLVHWRNEQNAAEVALEAWDVKAAQHSRPMPLFEHTVSAGNWAVSPDGKFFAVVVKNQNKPQVFLYPTGGTGNTIRFPIPGMEPQWAVSPAAMAFSPDGRRLAVLYEHEGAAAVYTWRVSDAKLIGPHLLPAGTLPPAPAEPLRGDPQAPADQPHPAQSFQLSWIGDGGAWLVRGDAVVESDTGRVLGNLGAAGAVSQWVSGTTCVLAYREGGQLRLAHVQLNPKGLPAPQPVAKPVTRASPAMPAAPPRK